MNNKFAPGDRGGGGGGGGVGENEEIFFLTISIRASTYQGYSFWGQ